MIQIIYQVFKSIDLDYSDYLWDLANIPFVIHFYAALKNCFKIGIGSEQDYGASRYERVRHIVIPHLYPVATFIILICLMDKIRDRANNWVI